MSEKKPCVRQCSDTETKVITKTENEIEYITFCKACNKTLEHSWEKLTKITK